MILLHIGLLHAANEFKHVCTGPSTCYIELTRCCMQIGATRCITIDGREGTLREYLIAIDEGPHPSVTYGFHPTRPGEKSLVERPRYGEPCLMMLVQQGLAFRTYACSD